MLRTPRVYAPVHRLDEYFRRILNVVQSIITGASMNKREWQSCFNDIQAVMDCEEGLLLYDRIERLIEYHISKMFSDLRTLSYLDCRINVLSGALLKYTGDWLIFSKACQHLHQLLICLNKQLDGQMPLANRAYSIWKERLQKGLSMRLSDIAIQIITKNRKGMQQSDMQLCKDYINSLVMLDQQFPEMLMQNHAVEGLTHKRKVAESPVIELYVKNFERPFLKQSLQHFKSLVRNNFTRFDCSAYMERVLAKIGYESDLALKWLHRTTEPKIMRLCYDVFARSQLSIFNSVCRDYICNDSCHQQDLHHMYFLLQKVNGLDKLLEEFGAFVKKRAFDGMSSITASRGNLLSDPTEFVRVIVDLYKEYTEKIAKVFGSDQNFTAIFDQSLQAVVNHREPPSQTIRAPEILNRYIDTLMRKGSKLTDEEVESAVESSMIVFRYIEDKDLFKMQYEKMLSYRLIGSLSYALQLEEQMIIRMKEACGHDFVHKLSRMYSDIGTSATLTTQFSEDKSKRSAKQSIIFNAMILQSGAWPFSSPRLLASDQLQNTYEPPPILNCLLLEFEKFYSRNHVGRKIDWLFNHSTVDVRLKYLAKQYTVTMNVIQFSILLAFANRDNITIAELGTTLKITSQTTIKLLQGFVDSKILLSNYNSLNDAAVIRLNTNFSSQKSRFKIIVQQSTKNQEQGPAGDTKNLLQQDRKHLMECALVRIMKARKLMKHNELIDEAIGQMKRHFRPDVTFIKKTIESLIEKQFIRRTDVNSQYEYIV